MMRTKVPNAAGISESLSGMLNSAGLRHMDQMGVCVQAQSNRHKTPAATNRTQNPKLSTGSRVCTGRAAGCTPAPQPERPHAHQRC